MEKKGYLKPLLITSIILVFILIVFFVTFFWKSQDNPVRNVLQKAGIIPEDDDDPIPYDEIEKSSGGSSSSGGSGGGGSGTGSSSSGGSGDCIVQQLSYSLINKKTQEVCNELDEEICLNKTITCSVDLENRDAETSGLYKIKISFFEKGKTTGDPIETKNFEQTIPPTQKQKFKETINLQSTGEEGIANQEIVCFYNTFDHPVKEICP